MEQRSEAWHVLRKKKIGSSDAPIIMGVSPWKTPLELWEEKIGLRKNVYQTFAMQRGNELEPIALDLYNQTEERECKPAILFHKEYDFMMASLDGYDGETIVEIKCPGKKDHASAAEGRIPDKYYPQLQHQMMVAGVDRMDYFSYHEDSYFLLEVVANEEYQEELLEKEKEFWDCVKTFSPPSPTDLYFCKNDALWESVASEWKEAKEYLDIAKERESALRERLISLADNRNCLGSGVKVTKNERLGTIDYSKIKELEDIDLNIYRKEPIVSWTIKEV